MIHAIENMFAQIATRYDLANDVLSFGMHRRWKAQAVHAANPQSGEQVLDICCGTGDIAFLLQERAKAVIGLDFVSKMLKEATRRRETKINKSQYPIFIQGDALALPFAANSFDVVTISFGIRNVDDVTRCLNEIKRVLKPAGRIVVLEFGKPRMPIFREVYNFYAKHCMPLIGQMLTGDRLAYEYLPETARKFPDGENFLNLLKESEYQNLSSKALFSGLAYIYYATKQKESYRSVSMKLAEVAYVC